MAKWESWNVLSEEVEANSLEDLFDLVTVCFDLFRWLLCVVLNQTVGSVERRLVAEENACIVHTAPCNETTLRYLN